ncbi:MAG: 30S ribosomal protein S6 [Verrucomicrobiae bacterium]|nr:30S ribosomal protein S6 [Verrucomicrobiae bacterium]
MKRYEGLFILCTRSGDDKVPETLEKISREITAAGGRVETIQKMERKPFARVANKKHSAGFYANVIFSIAPSALATLRNRFALDENIFRVMFTVSPEPKPAK